MADALDRAARSGIAAHALMVDAKDEAAAGFYRHHGFIAPPDSPLTLILPLATALASRKMKDNAGWENRSGSALFSLAGIWNTFQNTQAKMGNGRPDLQLLTESLF